MGDTPTNREAAANSTSSSEGASGHLRRFVDEHRRFEQLMDRHQEALVGFEAAEARRLFETLRCELLEHMQREEQELLPAYVEIGQWPRGGHPELIPAEHRQIWTLANHLARRLEELEPAGRLTRRTVIQQLDAEKSLKGMLEHHWLREETHLYQAVSRLECHREP